MTRHQFLDLPSGRYDLAALAHDPDDHEGDDPTLLRWALSAAQLEVRRLRHRVRHLDVVVGSRGRPISVRVWARHADRCSAMQAALEHIAGLSPAGAAREAVPVARRALEGRQ